MCIDSGGTKESNSSICGETCVGTSCGGTLGLLSVNTDVVPPKITLRASAANNEILTPTILSVTSTSSNTFYLRCDDGSPELKSGASLPKCFHTTYDAPTIYLAQNTSQGFVANTSVQGIARQEAVRLQHSGNYMSISTGIFNSSTAILWYLSGGTDANANITINNKTYIYPKISNPNLLWLGTDSIQQSRTSYVSTSRVYTMAEWRVKKYARVRAIIASSNTAGTIYVGVLRPSCFSYFKYCFSSDSCIHHTERCQPRIESMIFTCQNQSIPSHKSLQCTDQSTSAESDPIYPSSNKELSSRVDNFRFSYGTYYKFTASVSSYSDRSYYIAHYKSSTSSYTGYYEYQPGDYITLAALSTGRVNYKSGTNSKSFYYATTSTYKTVKKSEIGVMGGVTISASFLVEEYVRVAVPHRFLKHPCPTSPPRCTDYILARLFFNVANNFSKITGNHSIPAEVPISEVELSISDEVETYRPVVASVPPHPGTSVGYLFYFGNERFMKYRTPNVTITPTTPGTFNLTVHVWNRVSFQNKTVEVPVNHWIGFGSLLLYYHTAFIPGVQRVMYLLLGQASNTTITINWDDGTSSVINSSMIDSASTLSASYSTQFVYMHYVRPRYMSSYTSSFSTTHYRTMLSDGMYGYTRYQSSTSNHYYYSNKDPFQYLDGFIPTTSSTYRYYFYHRDINRCHNHILHYKKAVVPYEYSIHNSGSLNSNNFVFLGSGYFYSGTTGTAFIRIRFAFLMDLTFFHARYSHLSSTCYCSSVQLSFGQEKAKMKSPRTFTLGASSYQHNLDEFRVRYVEVKPVQTRCCIRFDFSGCAAIMKRITVPKTYSPNNYKRKSTVNVTMVNPLTTRSFTRKVDVLYNIVNIRFLSPVGIIRTDTFQIIKFALDRGSYITWTLYFDSRRQSSSYITYSNTNFTGEIRIPASQLIRGNDIYTVLLRGKNFNTNELSISKAFTFDYSVSDGNLTHPSAFRRAYSVIFRIKVGTKRFYRYTVFYGNGGKYMHVLEKRIYGRNDTYSFGYAYSAVGVYTVRLVASNDVSSITKESNITIQNRVPYSPSLTIKTDSLNIPLIGSPAKARLPITLVYTGSDADISTDVTARVTYNNSVVCEEPVPWKTTVKTIKLANCFFSDFGKFPNVYVKLTNMISSLYHYFTYQVDEPLDGLKVEPSLIYVESGSVVTFNVTKTAGSRVFYVIAYNSVTENRTVPGIEMPGTFSRLFSTPEKVTLSVQGTNFVSTKKYTFPKMLEVLNPVAPIQLIIPAPGLLSRKTNTTSATAFYLCYNSGQKVPTEVFYTIDFGDNTATYSIPKPIKCSNSNSKPSSCPVLCAVTSSHVFRSALNFPVSLWSWNKVSNKTLSRMYPVYSQIINFTMAIDLDPKVANDPFAIISAKENIFPLKFPVHFSFNVTFGAELGITYSLIYKEPTWHSSKTVPASGSTLSITFYNQGTYTVTASAVHPKDTVTLKRKLFFVNAIGIVMVTAARPCAMRTFTTLQCSIENLGDESCFKLDLNSIKAVLYNVPVVLFGDKNACKRYFKDDMSYYNSTLSKLALASKNYFDFEYISNTSNYYTGNVSFMGRNKVSQRTSFFEVVITKGPCEYPRMDLRRGTIGTRDGSFRYMRRDNTIVKSNLIIECYNDTARLTWDIEHGNSKDGPWTSAVDHFKKFFQKFPTHSGNIVVKKWLTGFASRSKGKELKALRLPAFSMETNKFYRVKLNVQMVEEPKAKSEASTILEIRPAPLRGCIEVDGENAFPSALAKWENPLNVTSCTVDEDVFYEGGETDGIEHTWFCTRPCEGQFAYSYASESLEMVEDAGNETCSMYNGIPLKGCFRKGVYPEHKLMSVNLTDWNDRESPPASWAMKEYSSSWTGEDNVATYLYYFRDKNTLKSIVFETMYMYENEDHNFVLLVKDKKSKRAHAQPFNVGLLTGSPPKIAVICTANCASGSKGIAKVDPNSKLCTQATIENIIPGVEYFFQWNLSEPVQGEPSQLTEIVKNAKLAANKDSSWINKTSTKDDKPGMSFDTNYPTFPTPSASEYYILQVFSWRLGAANLTGFKPFLFQINTAPNISQLQVTAKPPSGYGLDTVFRITCSNAQDEDMPLTYRVGYSSKLTGEVSMSDCIMISDDNQNCDFDIRLPQGSASDDYELRLCVAVKDVALMSSVFSNHTMRVRPPKIVISQLNAKDYLLQNLEAMSSQSPTAFISTSLAVVTQLVIENAEQSGEGAAKVKIDPVHREWLLIRIVTLVKIVVHNYQDSDGIAVVTQSISITDIIIANPDLVSKEIVNQSSAINLDLQAILRQKITDQVLTTDEISTALSSILNTAANSVTEIAKMSHQNNSGAASEDDVRNAYDSAEKGIHGVLEMGALTLVIGERPMTITQGNAAVEIQKARTARFSDQTMESTLTSDCSKIAMGSTNGFFDVFDPHKPNKSEPAFYAVMSFVVKKENTVVWTNRSSEVSSRVVELAYVDDKGEEFKVENTGENGTIEMWLDTAPSALVNLTRNIYQRTRPVDEAMDFQEGTVREGGVLFIDVIRERNLSIYQAQRDAANLTTDLSWVNSSYRGDVKFHVFLGVNRRPSEEDFDAFCEVPRKETIPCSLRMDADVPPDTVTEAASDTQQDPATNGTLIHCYCDTGSENATEELCSAYKGLNGTKITHWCKCDETACVSVMHYVPKKVNPCALVAPAMAQYRCAFGTQQLNTTDRNVTVFYGVRAVLTNSTRINKTDSNPNSQLRADADYKVVGFRSFTFSTGCLYFDKKINDFSSKGCYTGYCSQPERTQCFCTHLTSFSAAFYVPPIKFDPRDSAWLKLDENPIAFALCLSLVLFYFIVVIWARRRDRDDITKAGAAPLPDNDPRDAFAYEVTVWTGHRSSAATTAHVSIHLAGEFAETEPRLLVDEKRMILQSGDVNSFLLTTPRHLGSLTHLRVWHDNSGTDPSWYFSRMLVEDLATRQKFYFIFNDWLAIDEGDCILDRVIPVAGKEEVNGFENVFWTRGSRNLYDGHLWFSVVTRPPRSRFTRVQRATCCLVLLMMTMTTNLMFFEGENRVESPKLISLGTFTVSLHSIFMATVGTLIVVPINVIIVLLFRNRKERPIKRVATAPMELLETPNSPRTPRIARRPSTANPENIRITEGLSPGVVANPPPPATVTMETIAVDTTGRYLDAEQPRSRMKRCLAVIYPFPWWAFFIGYFLAFASVVSTTYVMVEMAGTLGEAKTAEWLGSMAISLAQSILVVQPIKILALALVYALIIKTPEEDIDEVSRELISLGLAPAHDSLTLDDLNDPDKLSELHKRKRAAPPPPEQGHLEELREKRQKEKEMQRLIKDIAFYIIFMVVLMSMAYTNQDTMANQQNTAVTKMFSRGFQNNGIGIGSVKTFETFWEFINETVIPHLYPTQCYHGSPCPLMEGKLTSDPQLWLVRPIQLRQVRMPNPENCSLHATMVNLFPRCSSEYSLMDEETRSFDPEWKVTDKKDESVPQYWRFTSALDVYGSPFWGTLSVYGGGGYIAPLPAPADAASAAATELFEWSWLDLNTRAVFIEFLLYNPGTNLYTVSYLIVEVFNGGGFVISPAFYTLRLDRYYGINFAVYAALDAISLFFILYFIVREIIAIKRMRWAYFQDFWHGLNGFQVVFCILEISFYSVRIVAQKAVKYYMNKYPSRFINFQYLVMWDQLNQFMLGLIVFIFTVRSLQLLSFNRKMLMLGRVLSIAKKPLAYFLLQFALVFFSFSQMGYLMFFTVVTSFHSFASTVETLGVMSLNKFDFSEFAKGAGNMGLLFFFLYMVSVSFILINFFLTIVNEAFARVKLDWGNTKNKYEILDFILTQTQKFFGCGGGGPKQNADSRFAYISDSPDVDETYDAVKEKVDTLMDRLMLVLNHEGQGNKNALRPDVDLSEDRHQFTDLDDPVPLRSKAKVFEAN